MRALVLACCCLAALTAADPPPQLVVFDQEITVGAGTSAWPCRPGLPADWTRPVNYVGEGGALHIHWEVLDNPSPEVLVLQLGWTFPGGGDRPFHLSRFTMPDLKPGVYESRHPFFLHFWPKEAKDYTAGITGITSFLRNEAWGVVGVKGGIRLRVTMTVVPSGGRYTPPARLGAFNASGCTAIPDVLAALRAEQWGQALALAEQRAKGGGAAAAEAKQVIAAYPAFVSERVAIAGRQIAWDPLLAHQRLATLAAQLKGTAFAAALAKEVATLAKHPAYVADLPAAEVYLAAQPALAACWEKAHAFHPGTSKWKDLCPQDAAALTAAYARLEREHPRTLACQRLTWWMERLSLTAKAAKAE